MFDVGPLPREAPGRRVLPADVFKTPIPDGTDGRGNILWLHGNGVQTSGIQVTAATIPAVEMDEDDVEIVPDDSPNDPQVMLDLCWDPGSEAYMDVNDPGYGGKVLYTRLRHICPTSIDDGTVKEQLGHAMDIALNRLLWLAVDDLAVEAIPVGTNDLRDADAAVLLNTNARGMVGIPANQLVGTLEMNDPDVVTPLGNRVWVHPGTKHYGTSDAWYDTRVLEWNGYEMGASAATAAGYGGADLWVYTSQLWVAVAIGDYAGAIA